jgi:hypothetical protein
VQSRNHGELSVVMIYSLYDVILKLLLSTLLLCFNQDLMGLVKVAAIMSQSTNKYYYWLGAVNKWRYLLARDVPVPFHKQTKKD